MQWISLVEFTFIPKRTLELLQLKTDSTRTDKLTFVCNSWMESVICNKVQRILYWSNCIPESFCSSKSYRKVPLVVDKNAISHNIQWKNFVFFCVLMIFFRHKILISIRSTNKIAKYVLIILQVIELKSVQLEFKLDFANLF